MFRDLPDSSSKIVYRPSGEVSKSLEIGYHEEKVEFVEIDDMPKAIREIMEQMAPERLSGEGLTIIHYRKRIGLEGEKIRVFKRKIRALYTFFRLNVSSFLAPLDLPFEELAVSTSRLHATVRQIPKVYYLDLVLHITTLVEEETKSEFEYYRIVLDKRGIKRIQKLPLPSSYSGTLPETEVRKLEVVAEIDPEHASDSDAELDEERNVINSQV